MAHAFSMYEKGKTFSSVYIFLPYSDHLFTDKLKSQINMTRFMTQVTKLMT